MLTFLFQRLTPSPLRGGALFAAVTAKARAPHWYLAGGVPDTLDGRFAMLATIAALVMVRLERGGEAANAAAVALTERFVEAMDAEHRQMGINDPTLGKKVRKLVGALGRRIELWRGAVEGERPWADAVRDSLYRANPPAAAALSHSADELRLLWSKLVAMPAESLAAGKFE